MLALVVALLYAIVVIAAGDNSQRQIHGSVIFARTGERTPVLSSEPRILTALGAQQLYRLGEAFRGRYINSLNGQTGLGEQPISKLSANLIDNDEIFILTANNAFSVASAQAFMQGLYPPFMLNEISGVAFDKANLLANGSYLDYPLSGYQYPLINTASDLDPMSVWVDGAGNCPNAALSSYNYYDTTEFQETRNISKPLYLATGFNTALSDVLIESQWDYYNAYLIYDYLNYQYSHDEDTYLQLAENETFTGVYDDLRFFADQQQFAIHGNLSGNNQIQAMAGKTLAAKVLGQFQELVSSIGQTPRLSLLIGEHEPFMSLFALTELQFLNSHFFGLPAYGSSMVFELFSVSSNNSIFPTDEAELWVRFLFHNGTSFPANDSLQSFPLFGRGPSQTDMPWLDFQDMMSRIMTSIPDWCNACNANSIFCEGFDNSTITIEMPDEKSDHDLSPQVAGVIGAAVTLGVLALAFILAMLVGGIRFHNVNRRMKSELGGFKGSSKLHSDADLSLSKNGAVAGIVSMGNNDKEDPKERIGSWELRVKEGGRDLGDGISRQESLEEEGVTPFAKPVAPDERV